MMKGRNIKIYNHYNTNTDILIKHQWDKHSYKVENRLILLLGQVCVMYVFLRQDNLKKYKVLNYDKM